MIEAATIPILSTLAVLLCVAGLFRPTLALYGYLIIFMVRLGEFVPWFAKVRFELIVGSILILRALLTPGGAQRLFHDSSRIYKRMALFFLFCLLSVPFSVSPKHAWERYIDFLKIFAFSTMVVALIERRRSAGIFLALFVAMTTWNALVPLVEYLRGNFIVAQGVRRVLGASAFFQNPNGLANVVCQSLPFIYYGFRGTRSLFAKGLYATTFAANTYLILLTGSRGGFLFLLTMLLLFAYRSERRAIAFIRVFALGFVVLLVMAPDYLARYGTILAFGQSDYSASSRIDGLIHGIGMCVKRPILGVGIGCYPVARGMWFGWSLWAHNLYGEILGEMGLVGTAVWFLFLVTIFKTLRAIRSAQVTDPDRDRWRLHMTFAIEAVLIGRLVAGMTTHSLGVFIWYILAALTVVVHRHVERWEEEELEAEREEEKEAEEIL